MRKYELLLLIDPTLSDEARGQLVNELKSELDAHAAKLVTEDVWGVKPLAYKINNNMKGFYLLWTVESEGAKFFELTKIFNLHKALWRHMFTRIED